MIDIALRPTKDRLLEPLVAVLAPRVGPLALTSLALAAGLGAAAAAAGGLVVVSVLLWLFGRVLDGLDGAVARRRDGASDLGGYLDIVADTVVYAAVPIGIAVGVGDGATWVAVGVLLATLYVNTVSWTYLAALFEKRRSGAGTTGEATSVRMPPGLVEGAETIVLYTAMLAVPSLATAWFLAMAVLVALTVLQRVVAASVALRGPARPVDAGRPVGRHLVGRHLVGRRRRAA
ncbi:MAG: CDP-alcohol phosphatidyltransferase family protein [Ilumatobacteraceae bacterium]